MATKKKKLPVPPPPAPKFDVSVSGVGGSVVLVHLLTEEARDWVEENVQEPMYYGPGVAVEARYLDNLLEGMREVLRVA